MRNKLKSPLYYYIDTQLRSKSVPFIGGLAVVQQLIDLLELAIEDCCIPIIKTNNNFLKNAQQILQTYTLPKDKLKLQVIIDYQLQPFINCCIPPVPPPPTLVSVEITGATTSTGQDVQLTAIGTYSDGSIQDLTTEGIWSVVGCAEVVDGLVSFTNCVCPDDDSSINTIEFSIVDPEISANHNITFECQ